jgi:Flp pilus assembly protein TadD
MANQADLSDAIAAFQRGDLDLAQSLAERGGGGQAEHLLGLIHCRRGDYVAGVGHFRAAAEAEPDNAAYQLMLARALVDSGRPQEVLAMPEPVRDSRPESIALWHARAEAAQALEDWPVAAEGWQILAAARPSDWRAWSNLGNALAGLDRWDEAANALGRAVALHPGELELARNYVSALIRAGHSHEAAEQLERMLDSTPDDASIRLTLARLLADLGRNEDAMAQFDKAAQFAVGGSASGLGDKGLIQIALGKRYGAAPVSDADQRAVRELASLLERTNRMEALRNLLDEAEQYGIAREVLGYPAAAAALRDGDPVEAKRLLVLESPEVDPVRWHRLMAKIEDTIGNPAAAFAAAEAMNRSVHDYDGWVTKGAEYRRRIHVLADTITPEWGARIRPLKLGPRPSPAFLIGFPRSGTTLLDTFLMGHPDTQVLEEFHMLGAAETVLGHVSELPNRSPELLEQARRAYFEELDRHIDPDGPGFIIDKLPLNMLGLSVIYRLFPDARVIFAQRHPCDAVLSGFMQSFTLNDAMACFLDIEHAADLYDAVMGVFTRSRDALPIATHTLVYEDLVADPGAALPPLIEFLGLEWRPELLDHRSTAKARGAIITPSYDQVIQPLNKAPSGRWRRYEKQMKPALPILLPWAMRLGYSN